MKFRWRTLGGLLLVAAAGIGLALVFERRSPDVGGQVQVHAPAEGSFASAQRGRIVPLLVDGGLPPVAFVPAAPRDSEGDNPASGNRVQSLPTIRASAAGEAPAAPQLPSAFPQPHDLAPVGEAEFKDEVPALAGMVRHRVVDGDTLAALAERYLGDASRAAEIYEQNRTQLSSPEVLPLGVELVIGGQR